MCGGPPHGPNMGERHCSVFPFPACTKSARQGANVSSARRVGTVLLFLLPAPRVVGNIEPSPAMRKLGCFGCPPHFPKFKNESKAVLQLV